MQVTVSSKTIDFDNLEKHLRDAGLEAILTAAKVLVRHTSDKIPVDSGMARSTWAPLGRYLGVSVPVGGKPTARKNPARGENQSDFEIALHGATAYFRWSSDVKHYNINENSKIAKVSSSPWKSIPYGVAKAKEAFKADIIPAMRLALNASITFRERIY